MSEHGFLSRWHRRKVAARQGLQAGPEAVPRPGADADRADPAPSSTVGVDAAPPTSPAAQGASAGADAAHPAPLPEVDTLTPDSDFTPFMQRDVPLSTRSAALKKLFADPHFNAMDGLDVYIDDYSKPDAMPPGMLERLAHYAFLNQPLEDEAPAEGETGEGPVPPDALADAGAVALQQPAATNATPAADEVVPASPSSTTD